MPVIRGMCVCVHLHRERFHLGLWWEDRGPLRKKPRGESKERLPCVVCGTRPSPQSAAQLGAASLPLRTCHPLFFMTTTFKAACNEGTRPPPVQSKEKAPCKSSWPDLAGARPLGLLGRLYSECSYVRSCPADPWCVSQNSCLSAAFPGSGSSTGAEDMSAFERIRYGPGSRLSVCSTQKVTAQPLPQ